MEYRKLLTLALVPSILFFLLSLVSVALTTHYWIIGDWITPRGVKVQTSTFNDRTQSYTIDETIVYFTENDTDATIVSGCLCLTAAVVALIAWAQLRKPGMDTFDATVCAEMHCRRTDMLTSTEQTPILGTCCHCDIRCRRSHCASVYHPSLHQQGRRCIRLQIRDTPDGRKIQHEQVLHKRSGSLQLSS